MVVYQHVRKQCKEIYKCLHTEREAAVAQLDIGSKMFRLSSVKPWVALMKNDGTTLIGENSEARRYKRYFTVTDSKHGLKEKKSMSPKKR